MATVAALPDSRVVIPNVSWDTYEALLRDRGDDGPRMAYDRGLLEVMSPSPKHEPLNAVLGRFIEIYTEELGIDIRSTGSTTFRLQLKERGLEPDKSYYVQNESRVRGKDEIYLHADPPPDVAIEIDLRKSQLDKLGIYAALKIPEVWSHDGKHVVIHLLQDSGELVESPRSRAFPDLPPREIERFLERIGPESETQVIRAFRQWVQERSGSR